MENSLDEMSPFMSYGGEQRRNSILASVIVFIVILIFIGCICYGAYVVFEAYNDQKKEPDSDKKVPFISHFM